MTQEIYQSFKMTAPFSGHHTVRSSDYRACIKDKFNNTTVGKSYRIRAHICSPTYIIDDAGEAVNISDADLSLMRKLEDL